MLRRHVRVTMLATVAAVAISPACSTTTQAPSTSHTTTPATTSPPPQAHGVYEQCLIQHGVASPAAGPPPGPGLEPQGPLPGPPAEGAPGSTAPPPPPGVDKITWDNAVAACASLQPSPPNTP